MLSVKPFKIVYLCTVQIQNKIQISINILREVRLPLPSRKGEGGGWGGKKEKVGQICQIKGLVPAAHWQRATCAFKIESKDEEN